MTRTLTRALALVAMLAGLGSSSALTQETEIQYLSGHGTDDAIDWDFYCTNGRNSGVWSTIPVPSNWELQGFGDYNYGHDTGKADEQGRYRREFEAPAAWKGKVVRLVFDGVMTDTEVKVNGQSAGPIHQGGFYRFKYDISGLLDYGAPNLLEVTVSKVSANPSIEQAERKSDYWVFGGIFRPVWLEVLPREHIDARAVNAQAGGALSVQLQTANISTADRVKAEVLDTGGSAIAAFGATIEPGAAKVMLAGKAAHVENWTAETPALYRLVVRLQHGGEILHTVEERIGFRTIEVRPRDGIYLNGKKIRLKGVDRHCFWPDSGRALNRTLSYDDVRLIKGMNMNAVRMSHYPPDVHFLEACDELGLYVLDELAGWQRPPYDTKTGVRLVKEMVNRDVNHPSILFWDNGNEGGWNPELDGEFSEYDPQGRSVIHPSGFKHALEGQDHGLWETAINTDHYPSYGELEERLEEGSINMPTEFLHGLYDGGHGAGLDDYWKLMRASKNGAGGFLWVLADEGVVRTDKGGIIDTDGNHAPDGIVGPYRQKEGSYNTIKEIYCPVHVPLADEDVISLEDFSGQMEIINEYDFTNLNTCRFTWRWVKFAGTETETLMEGAAPGPDIPPGMHGTLDLGKLPPNTGPESAGALYLTALDGSGAELYTWSWQLSQNQMPLAGPSASGGAPVAVTESNTSIQCLTGDIAARFDKQTGRLLDASQGNKIWPLHNGPQRANAAEEATTPTVNHRMQGNACVLSFENPPGFETITWTVHPGGFLELDCTYRCEGPVPYHGISFNCDESEVRGKTWLGEGPYRVWKNRMKGTQFGVWSTPYNDTQTGLKDWIYPEFKGYFANVHWMALDTAAGTLRVGLDQPLFVRLFDFNRVRTSNRDPEWTPDPITGDLSILHAIPAVGTKFKEPEQLGPQSQMTVANGLYKVHAAFRLDPN